MSATTKAKNSFDQAISNSGLELTRSTPDILQLNIGKLCNLTCYHCHVNAGPKRKEIMDRETVDKILEWFEQTEIPTLDLTGGTPEMIPDFKHLVETVRSFKQPRRVMTRLNATIIEEPGFDWIPEFHKKHEIVCIASMPCYSPENVIEQRGEGTFEANITAFQKLNAVGYARDPKLELNFVYNPNGAFLPPEQEALEADYKREMKQHFDIDFNNLYCIANIAIARFKSYLKRNNQLADYEQLLQQAFNPATIDSLMCRNTINASYLGEVYDCDFNQMLKMHTTNLNSNNTPLNVWDIDPKTFQQIPIKTGKHCFACTAGSGSSCGGALT